MRQKDSFLTKRICLIVIVLVAVMGLTVGFAALQTSLSINGNTKIDKVGWDIRFENINVTTGSVEIGNDDVAATIDPTDPTKVTYNVTLSEPGDFYEFTVDVINKGSLPAKLDSIVKDSLTAEEDVYTNYTVSYVDSTLPTIGDKLATGEANKKTLRIRVEFDENVSAEELPTEAHSFELSYQLNYVQDK